MHRPVAWLASSVRLPAALACALSLIACSAAYAPDVPHDVAPAEGAPAAPNAELADGGGDARAEGNATLTLEGTGDFGTIVSGAGSAVQRLRVVNRGAASSAPLRLERSGEHAASFRVEEDECSGVALAAGAACEIGVRFTPEGLGALSARVVARSSRAADGAPSISLSGLALAAGALAATPGSLELGAVSTAGANVGFLELKNAGDGTLDGLEAEITGGDASSFAIVSNTCKGGVLPSSATCTIGVRLSPTSLGDKTASLTVTGEPGAATSVALSGRGVAPATLAGSASVDAGPLVIDSSVSTYVSARIDNRGGEASGPIALSLLGVDRADFQVVENRCPAAGLPPAGSCFVGLAFKPSLAGNKSASLVATASPGGTLTVPLTGIGITPSALAFAPGSHDFEAIQTGATSGAATFVLQNGGQAASPPLALSLTSPFALVSDACSARPLPGGGTCAVSVRLAGLGRGPVAASLQVLAPGDGGRVLAALPLRGQVLAPARLRVDSQRVDFGVVDVGAQPDAVLTVTNEGDVATTALTTALETAPEYAVVADACKGALLAPLARCSVRVRFTPARWGSTWSSLTVSGASGGNVTTSLAGTGRERLTLILNVKSSLSYPGGSGTVSGAGLVCGPTSCTGTFYRSTSNVYVRPTATAAVGSRFEFWYGPSTAFRSYDNPGLVPVEVGVVDAYFRKL